MESISDRWDYRNICKLAAVNDKFFFDFKSNSAYNAILEHVSEDQGHLYLEYILEHYRELIDFFYLFKKNDIIGNPKKFSYREYGEFSPSTLRYIKVLGDIISIFDNLNGKKIIEIGGGYGGQALIIHQLFKPKSYTIIDIQEAIELTDKYLSQNGINAQFIKPDEVVNNTDNFDLIVSNYAFSELNKNLQDIYWQNVIKRSENGYITFNFIDDDPRIISYGKEDIFRIFGEKNFTIIDEIPKTHVNNFIMYF